MSKIIPFPALLPKSEVAHLIACPPYDVINSEEARKLTAGNPYSLLHVTRAEVDLPPGVGEYDDRVYEAARQNFINFVKNGWLTRVRESFFVYRLESGAHSQTGLVCGASVDEYDSGLIRQHEKTRKDKEDDRTRLAYTLKAHPEPVIIVYRTDREIKSLLASQAAGEPLYDITDGNGVRHTLWQAKATDDIRDNFSDVSALYIADGHHRSAAASRVGAMIKKESKNHSEDERYNFFPVVIFPDDEVRIYRYDWTGDPLKRPLADVTMADIMDLADRGGIMPPKSTWFAPKLASGLFVYPLII